MLCCRVFPVGGPWFDTLSVRRTPSPATHHTHFVSFFKQSKSLGFLGSSCCVPLLESSLPADTLIPPPTPLPTQPPRQQRRPATTTSSIMCSSSGFQLHPAEEERVDQARSLLCEGASLLVQGQGISSTIDPTRRLHQCLDKFDRALRLAPHLRAHAVRILGGRTGRGVVASVSMGLSPPGVRLRWCVWFWGLCFGWAS